MLEIRDLTVNLSKNTILNDLNFKKKKKDSFAAIIGPSGIGKTTFLSAVCQLVPYQGEILWNNQPISLKRETLALVAQDYGLLPWLSVEQNISLGIKLKNNKVAPKMKNQMTEIVKDLNISALLTHYPLELSGGQKQRVALAKAFAMKPDLILLDEPFSALDTVVKAKAQKLMLSELAKKPTTTLMVTHDLSEALIFSDNILILTSDKYSYEVNPLSSIPPEKRQESEDFYQVANEFQKRIEQEW